ncbi:MAG: winged helix-turn-helix domain-containing protein [Haloferacaceae archaeon]
MSGLLPSEPDTSAASEADPRVVGLDDDEAGEVLAALSSETARRLLAELHDDPDSASGVADRADTSLQNAQYHLGRMRDAGLVEVVDTIYSEKGREMKVYAPADRPLVMFAGADATDERGGLRDRLRSIVGAVGALAGASAVVEYVLRDGPWLGGAAGGGASDGGGSVGVASTEATRTAEQAAGLPPGLLFLCGGLLALVVVVGVGALVGNTGQA